ncbi:inhibitor of kappa light polypeptide gene enhancer in b- kinase complex-associated protein, putative [Ichthyophthirius multifiliis]|uniref:Inhibitor of kappa light polypeptide gene enhancer in b-kinase complex-associated protein, putative n=1 Tax=Ichthyophthirius multifiliis TaxID=5932 RepID=G0QPQ7_ICHMU|nr:inhibitor of kappa light polypeptide gene enhancer in b- kinase complex-associated protein, putative [Ichthyophthirius multifiliis]EGR32772.1 inhibitor of kappa light polypeptide gene enhancer in b- kinase complex-associated protein, putative [Ichthyophthirius multifiliis]|eukprot:XP_004036758.1 inhibitor of kappa light polypeptide gene enhancer in b- kinase complex-associated protein, putative [Ichthyophthirius multifiliis]
MRNIILQDYYNYYIEDLDQVEAFDFEEFSLTLYILTKKKQIYVIQINENMTKHSLQNKIDLSYQIPEIQQVLGVKYILELESVIIVLKNGEIFKYCINLKEGESVGCIENGILGFSYSPNQDVIVIATGNNTLITLDNNFDIQNEVPLNDNNEEIYICNNQKNCCVYFSWKADAKFFVCNYPVKNGRKCLTRSVQLEVIKSAAKPESNNGIVQSVSEQAIQNLQGQVCWQPTSNLIVGYDFFKNNTRIIFWEKNGLRHGEFILNINPNEIRQSNEIYIQNILFNKDSEILAIQLDENILLYHKSNYQWFLKKIIQGITKILGIQFSVQNSKKLIVVYENQFIEIFDLQMSYSQCLHDNQQLNSQCLSVFVNGNQLNVTSFKRNIMPPPMSNFQFDLKNPVISFSVGRSFHLFQIDEELKVKEFFIKNDKYFEKQDRLRQFQYFDCVYYHSIFFISKNQNQQVITEIIINPKNLQVQQVFQKQISHPILCVCPSGFMYSQQKMEEQTNQFIYLANHQGTVFKYILNNQESQLIKNTQFELVPIKMQATIIQGQELLFGISLNHRLMILNNRIISSQATSFGLYDSYLLYTQNTSGMYQSLFVFDLNDPQNPITNTSVQIPGIDSKSLNVRNIERGCTIVILANDSLVFQLPRGNLETINCRVIFLRKVKELICLDKYYEAFELCKSNKLDLNLIFDINQNKFINNIQSILQSFQKTEYINILIAAIKSNLSEELQYCVYDNEYQQSKNNHISFLNKKVNIFCDTIINALNTIGDQNYLYCKMTAHIKKTPTELEYVLSEIKKMKDQEYNIFQEYHPPHLNPETNKKYENIKKVSSKSLLEFVCWLANADKIYDISLGTYDLELVAMVAQFTQKDPKEYIPYLESLKKIDDLVERKYTINMDLKRYDKAVLELSLGNEKQKEIALQLIKKHNLFNVGLKAFNKDNQLLKTIKILMGDFLFQKKEFQQALLSYESVGAFQQALQVCISSGNVKKALFFSQKLGKNSEVVVNELIQQLLQMDNMYRLVKLIKKQGNLKGN